MIIFNHKEGRGGQANDHRSMLMNICGKVSKRQKMSGIQILSVKNVRHFKVNSRFFLHMFLKRNTHFCAFEPLLVCSTYSIWSLHPKHYKKQSIFLRNSPEKTSDSFQNMSGIRDPRIPAFRTSELE